MKKSSEGDKMKFKINAEIVLEWVQEVSDKEGEVYLDKQDFYNYELRKQIIDVLSSEVAGDVFNYNVDLKVTQIFDEPDE